MARTQSACVQFSEYRLSEMISFKDIETKKKKKKCYVSIHVMKLDITTYFLTSFGKGPKPPNHKSFFPLN